ncbi:hypothetical protein JTB14_021345 [Gonioctena quinquepunctata]|nr:hypothetical protein JTB14_021345 [Gonioctena quinquepunctata]
MSHYDLFSINNIRNINNITLDLVLTNMVDATVDVSELSLTDISDKNHPPLDITFSFENSHISINKSEVGNPIYNFKKGDFMLYHLLSQCEWSDMFDLDDADEAVDMFYNTLNNSLKNVYQKKHLVIKKRKNFHYGTVNS